MPNNICSHCGDLVSGGMKINGELICYYCLDEIRKKSK